MAKPEKLVKLVKRIPGATWTYHAVPYAFRRLFFLLRRGNRYVHRVYNPVMIDVLDKTGCRSHISDHLSSIFYFALDVKPGLMVELGTNEGESTRALLAAASTTGSTLLSVDNSLLITPIAMGWQSSRNMRLIGTGFDACSLSELKSECLREVSINLHRCN